MICFQVPQGLKPPIISMCNYNPFSIPTMWNFVQPEEHPSPSPEFDKIKAAEKALSKFARIPFTENEHLTIMLAAMGYKLYAKSTLFTLLRNIPNMTFDQIFDKLGPRENHTIESCSNGIKERIAQTVQK